MSLGGTGVAVSTHYAASKIFNVSLGAVRPFLVTSLASLGKIDRQEMEILAEFAMRPGDLYVLEGYVNKR